MPTELGFLVHEKFLPTPVSLIFSNNSFMIPLDFQNIVLVDFVFTEYIIKFECRLPF